FLTHTLFSSASLRFSERQKCAILDWGRAMKATGVPTLYGLSKLKDRIHALVGDPTERVVSLSGNVFYLNGVKESLIKDYGNPLTRFAMMDYPRDDGKRMSQVQNGSKMLLDIPPEVGSPAVRVNGDVYFVRELVLRADGSLFIPERFFYSEFGGSESVPASGVEQVFLEELCALGHEVTVSEGGLRVADERVIVPISTFMKPYPELVESGVLEIGFTVECSSYSANMPNHLHGKTRKGMMAYAVPLIVFMDDVSGNISKQWNKHHVIYMSNANLPREMIEKEFCVRFVTSSPHAAPMELMAAMKQSICQAAEDGIIAYDCQYDEEVLLCPYALFVAGDNPMQAEECSHGGLACNYFCRTCMAGGTQVQKQSLAGYSALFKARAPRTPEGTRKEIERQILGAEGKLKDATALTGTCDATTRAVLNCIVELGKQLRKRVAGEPGLSEDEVQKRLGERLEEVLKGSAIEDHINPLLGMPGMNIHLDTPTEVLHTVLLGVVKYYWSQTVVIVNKAKALDTLQVRLAALSTDGLNAPSWNPEYMIWYKGSLIGKHFKSLAQVMPFVIYDLVPPSVLQAWNLIGELVVQLWHTTIEDIEEYLAKLSRTIEDLLNVTAQCAPSILVLKPKFHFLVHLPAFIRRFGPAILYSTERYESFNHVFRLSQIYSNRQAPSRDSCQAFAANDIAKHIISGGYWYDGDCKKWVRAGVEVMEYIEAHPELRRFLGLWDAITQAGRGSNGAATSRHDPLHPVLGKATKTVFVLRKTNPREATILEGRRFYRGASFTTKTGDEAWVDGYVFITVNDKLVVGRVLEMLVPDDSDRLVTHVALQLLEFLPSRHHKLQLPRLIQTDQMVVACPVDIECVVNVQHDCATSECNTTTGAPALQERQQTSVMHKAVVHSDTNMFV
ncbi:hypothetical protein K466DRAFT_473373, partial [Polyporus arcularius HHB13444]